METKQQPQDLMEALVYLSDWTKTHEANGWYGVEAVQQRAKFAMEILEDFDAVQRAKIISILFALWGIDDVTPLRELRKVEQEKTASRARQIQRELQMRLQTHYNKAMLAIQADMAPNSASRCATESEMVSNGDDNTNKPLCPTTASDGTNANASDDKSAETKSDAD